MAKWVYMFTEGNANGYICLPKVMQTCANCLVVRVRTWLR